MGLVSKPNDLWVLKPTKEDLISGARYAAITLPWTFNRMMMNTGSTGQQFRALNIAKGIVGQEMIRRELERRGVRPLVQKKSHRDEDLFDLDVLLGTQIRKLDIKSINYYTNYPTLDRQPLSPKLIIDNAHYPGPDWRRFFPMLIPHTQILQDKETYCFVIASSIDTRKDTATDRCDFVLTAFPYGESMAFLASQRLCLARESIHRGLYLTCSYETSGLLDSEEMVMNINGEWEARQKRVEIRIAKNTTVTDVGPFSCVSSFQIGKGSFDQFYGRVVITVCRNEFDEAVLNSLRRDINQVPLTPLTIQRTDFCNLILPNSYIIYVVGWIMKADFLKICRNYSGWVWPDDRVNRFENQPWTQITEKDKATISSASFGDCIQTKPSLLKAGWMKTTGRGGGACCYVFPNIGHGGGVKETNLYVLPADLHVMENLANSLVTG